MYIIKEVKNVYNKRSKLLPIEQNKFIKYIILFKIMRELYNNKLDKYKFILDFILLKKFTPLEDLKWCNILYNTIWEFIKVKIINYLLLNIILIIKISIYRLSNKECYYNTFYQFFCLDDEELFIEDFENNNILDEVKEYYLKYLKYKLKYLNEKEKHK